MKYSNLLLMSFFAFFFSSHIALASTGKMEAVDVTSKPYANAYSDCIVDEAGQALIEELKAHSPHPLDLERQDIGFLSAKFPFCIAYLTAGEGAFTEDPQKMVNPNQLKIIEGLDDPLPTLALAMKDVLLSQAYGGDVFEHRYPDPKERAFIAQDDRQTLNTAILHTPPGALRTLLQELNNPKKSILDDLVTGAKILRHIVAADGEGDILFLGRTPCWLQVSYEELLAQSAGAASTALGGDNHIKHVSFSGMPDVISLRDSDVVIDAKVNLLRNLVTPQRLEFFENYLTEQGLNTVTDKLYIVDILGTGGSLNSFLRILNHYYTIALGRRPPAYHFVGMNMPLANCYQLRQGKKVWGYNHSMGTLTFEGGFKDHGVEPMTISASPMNLSKLSSHLFDDSFLQHYMVHGTYFPANRWSEDHRHELKTGGTYYEYMYGKYLRPALRMGLKRAAAKES